MHLTPKVILLFGLQSFSNASLHFGDVQWNGQIRSLRHLPIRAENEDGDSAMVILDPDDGVYTRIGGK